MECASPLAEHVAAVVCFSDWDGSGFSMWEQAQGGVPFRAPDETFSLIELTAQAACGDVAAQREIAAFSLYAALMGDEANDRLALILEGLMLARMAASQGEPGDQLLCASMLSLAAMFSTGNSALEFAAETVARIERLADEPGEVGEQAARILSQCAAAEAPQTLKLAKKYRAALIAAEGGG